MQTKKQPSHHPTAYTKWLSSMLLVGLLTATFCAYSVERTETGFTRVFAPPGLSQNNVTSIAQDHHGFMWFGTQDGLHRFDGYKFKIYRHDPDDERSLATSFVRSLFVDRTGTLWVGTEPGLNRFDEANDGFIRYRHEEGNPASIGNDTVYDISEDINGSLWIATAGGLYQFDKANDTFARWNQKRLLPDSLPGETVMALAPDSNGIWVGTTGGLAYLNFASNTLDVYQNDPNNEQSISSNDVRAVYLDSKARVWVGTFGGGVNILDPDDKTFSHMKHDRTNTQSISHNRIARILEDETGLFWLGTFGGGLTTFDPSSGRFERLKHEPSDTRSLSHDQVRSVFEDSAGLIWIGTGTGGVNRYDRRTEQFAHFRHRTNDPSSLSHNGISALHVDINDTLWIGTFGGGLNRFLDGGRYLHYRHEPTDSQTISSDRVFAIVVDHAGALWAGTGEDGLNRYDPNTEQFTRYAHEPTNHETLAHDRVRALYEDSQGRLWVGTYGGGLDLLNRKTGVFTHHKHRPNDPTSISGNGVRVIFEDSTGNLWIGTGTAGLNHFDPTTRRFQRFDHDASNPSTLSHNKVQAIHESDDGRLWIGTPAGLNELNRESNTFRVYTRKHGLANDVVYSIIDDTQGGLWLSTNQGISRFDLRTGEFQNYDVSDGLQANEFNSGAGAIDSSGNIIFGGINGITKFNPTNLSENSFVPPIVLTDLLLFNQIVIPKTEVDESLLTAPLHLTDSITLTHRDSVVSFEFASLDYAAPGRNQYAYKLNDFNEDWITTGADNRFATFTNLPPGKYDFQVRATNSGGQWVNDPTVLSINVLPPPWRTWWAYTLYVIGALAIVVQYLNSHRRRTQQLEKTVRERTGELAKKNMELEEQKDVAEAAARSKTAFLATMSHEIRTPLNAVMGMLQLLTRSNLSNEQTDYVETIHDSSAALLTIVDQILQYSRLEQGRVEVEEIEFSPRRLVRGVTTLMRAVADEKNVLLETVIDPTIPHQCAGDPDKIRQILTNLLSNAIRFTDKGRIDVTAKFVSSSSNQGQLELIVRDTGVGIPESARERVFEVFTQADVSITRKYGGTGMGLAICKELVEALEGKIGFESKENQGSTFWVNIPCNQFLSESRKTSKQRPSWKVLMVEDLEVNRQIVGGLLESEGHRITAYADGQTALDALDEDSFDLVLLDLHMPHMDGIEVARRIRERQIGGSRRVPIIALTAASTVDDTDEWRSAGIDSVMQKPFNYRRLVTLLDGLTKAEAPAQGTANSNSESVIDEAVIENHFRNLGVSKAHKLFHEALVTVESLAQEAVLQWNKKDLAGLHETVHKLSGACRSYGFSALGTNASRLEQHADTKDIHSMKNIIDRLNRVALETKEATQFILKTQLVEVKP